METPAAGRSLADLKREHGFHPGSRFGAPEGEALEQSPWRNYVRDLVLGYNDSLVSVFAATAGLAGAAFGSREILLAGLAVSIAGALSMAAGEYISTKSQAQYYDAERRREEEHLAKWPELERQELRESLEAKGVQPPLLDQVVEAIASDRKRFLDYMMRDEFGVWEESKRSPVAASSLIAGAFLVGAVVALAPYVWFDHPLSLQLSAALSLLGLFAAGMARAYVSRLKMFKAGLEMVFIGALAAAVTYALGRLVGVNL